MTKRNIYNLTAIARPVDPKYPTNRAVLILVPLAALVAAAVAYFGWGGLWRPGSAALSGALVAFGSWALTRELAPDDHLAAFVSMALAVAALCILGASGVLPVFLCLFLVRIVNRSTGLPLTPFDSVMLVIFFIVTTPDGQPLLLVIAALAFTLDALLRDPNRRSFVAAAVCLAAFAVNAIRTQLPGFWPYAMPETYTGFVIVVLVAWALLIALQPAVSSVGDASGERLSTARVKSGMVIGGLVALLGFNGPDPMTCTQLNNFSLVTTWLSDLWGYSCPYGDLPVIDPFVLACLIGPLLWRILPRKTKG